MFRSRVPDFRVLVRVLMLVLIVFMGVLAGGAGMRPGDAGATAPDAPIPSTLEEALERLQSTLPPPVREAVLAGADWDRAVDGQILRAWVSPRGSPLVVYCREQGLDHPEDIPGVLLRSYRRRLQHESMDLGQQVKERQAYWSGVLTPDKVAAAEDLSERALLDPALLRSAYRRDAALVMNDYGHADLGMQSPPLILREWALLDAWVVRQSRAQPDAARTYPQRIAGLDPSLQVLTLALGSGSTLLAINQSGIGHVVIVQEGAPAPLWRVDRIAAGGPNAEPLRCWRAEAGTRPCAPWRLGLLPPDAHGLQRFYIEAEYAQPAGGSRRHQLSLWRWDGRAATPLVVTGFAVDGEIPEEGSRVEGVVIQLGHKAHFPGLEAFGSCDGRQRVQRLQLTPANEVDELDTGSLHPEL